MSWPVDEANKIPIHGLPALIKDIKGQPYEKQSVLFPKGYVLFETGYGPSGLPHIGTFTEVARTSWVRQAFTELTGMPSKLLAFSDDMDGLRRVPDNVPNKEMMEEYLGMPLTSVPNPFPTKDKSFAAHNNRRLMAFLDQFGFDYQFASSTEYYTFGRFNDALRRVLQCHDEIVDTIRPTLGKDRAANYSPLMPIHPETGQVMQVKIDALVDDEFIIWHHDGKEFKTSVLDGQCKLQWKADWGMRWYALGVDYEMSGKDLIDSVILSSQICRILGGTPPVTLTYELFLDKDGKKISKSKGNGLSVEEWLRYGPQESLAHYIFANPQRAKKLYFELIPRATDEYLQNLTAMWEGGQPSQFKDNPVWYVHGGKIPINTVPISFGMLLNLASVANTEDPMILFAFIKRYAPATESSPFLLDMIDKAIAYYKDFIKSKKVYRAPSPLEITALENLRLFLISIRYSPDMDSEEIQKGVFFVGKRFPKMKEWFDCLYQVLLGQTEGPRFGVFVSLYGAQNTIDLIDSMLSCVIVV